MNGVRSNDASKRRSLTARKYIHKGGQRRRRRSLINRVSICRRRRERESLYEEGGRNGDSAVVSFEIQNEPRRIKRSPSRNSSSIEIVSVLSSYIRTLSRPRQSDLLISRGFRSSRFRTTINNRNSRINNARY